MNAIMTITPYRHAGTWVFDDERVGLEKEPFVSGVPEMIDDLVENIPHAERGFRLFFSSVHFPGAQSTAEWLREENDGAWYRCAETGREGWLCPAMFKYFETTPLRIFVRADALEDEDEVIRVSIREVRRLREAIDAGDLDLARSLIEGACEPDARAAHLRTPQEER